MKKLLAVFLFFLCCFASAAAEEALPRDEYRIAKEFGFPGSSITEQPHEQPHWQTGDRKVFSILYPATAQVSVREAEAIYVGENIVFWADLYTMSEMTEGFTAELKHFDTEVIPLLRQLFGHEPSPGCDNDPLIHAVFSDRIGTGYLGYFSFQNQIDPAIDPNSNGMDIFFLNPILFSDDGKGMTKTLAHEFQHMIHNAADSNEDLFVDEGISCVAELFGSDTFGPANVRSYLNDTGISLINWPDSEGNNAYYGVSFLYMLYIYDRVGGDILQRIISEPLNGLDGIDHVLSGSGLTADGLFAEFASALLLNLLGISDEPYHWNSYVLPVETSFRDITELPCETFSEKHEVSQYGIDYYHLDCSEGKYRITFSGADSVRKTGLEIPGEGKAYVSGAVNNSESSLTLDLDLSRISAPVTFSWNMDIDIERGYDFLYMLLFDRDDESGTVLCPTGCSEAAPYGCAFTGRSAGADSHEIDLSEWAGETVRLKFVYLTDTAIINDGVLLSGFKVNGADEMIRIGEPVGFSEYQPVIPQRWLLTDLSDPKEPVIAFSDDGPDFSFICDSGEDGCYYGISAITREARTRAVYDIQAERTE